MPRPSPRGVRGRRPGTLAGIVRALDDPGRGALLDALVEARTRLRIGGARRGWEAETLAALVDGLLERFAALGVRPIHAPGETLELTRAGIAGRYEYHGAPFRPGERRKRVIVAAPGWRVGRRVVIRPTVREAPGARRG